MSQDLDALTGKVHGLTAAISIIAAALPPEASADVQETLRDLLAETASADLPAPARASMHALIGQVLASMEIGLRR